MNYWIHCMLSTKSNPIKTAYSCYFETQLDEENFGMSRKEHFKICNERLLEQLQKLQLEGIQFHSEVTNNYLIEQITNHKDQPPGKDLFTWEHCSSSTANGRMGVMRLIDAD